jgi:hypothetical protein
MTTTTKWQLQQGEEQFENRELIEMNKLVGG